MPREATQFKEGEVNNPDGRPKGSKSFTTKVREALECLSEGKGTSVEKDLIEAILKNAIKKGDVQAQRMIWNYLDGMPVAKTDLTTLGEKLPSTTIIGSPALAKIAEEYEQRILEELKKSNA